MSCFACIISSVIEHNQLLLGEHDHLIRNIPEILKVSSFLAIAIVFDLFSFSLVICLFGYISTLNVN